MDSSGPLKSTGAKCLAIDLGASSGRLVLGEIVDGCWKLREVGRFRTPTRTDTRWGYQCWEIEGIAHRIEEYLRGQKDGLTSLAVDSWGVDYVLLDSACRQVGVPICYRDKRTTGVMESLQRRIPREEIYRRTGIQFLPFNTLYQLAACVQQQPDWIAAADHFLMIPDYLHFRFSGVMANEYTNATTTQMCGLNGDWDSMLIDGIGLKRQLMKMPIAPGTILGNGTGASHGLKVIAPATHDTGSAVAGTPLLSEDEAYISSGTWSLMGIESVTPIATGEAMRMNFTNEGGLEHRFRILKNIMGMWAIQRVCEEQETSDFASLVQAASLVEAWRAVINLNDPEFLNPPSMTESIRKHCRNSNQPIPETAAEIARCIFDSLALCYRGVKLQLEALRGRKLSCIRIVGGGCQNKLLNQLCADACGLPVIAGPVEASALGNLSAQMIALGEVENLRSARDLICTAFDMDRYTPRAEVPRSVLERDELSFPKELKGEPCA